MKGKLQYAARMVGQKFDMSRSSKGCLEKAMPSAENEEGVRDAYFKYKRKKQWHRQQE